MAQKTEKKQTKEQPLSSRETRPANSSHDPTQPDEELVIDLDSLTEKKMNDSFGRELFPRDGRGSTSSESEEEKRKMGNRGVLSSEEPGGTSQHSVRQTMQNKNSLENEG